MVSITYKATTGAVMNSIGKFLNFPMSTLTTGLTCICRVDSYQNPIGAFSLIGQILSKLRPCCIMNTFRKTMIMNHLVDRQILYSYEAALINNLSGFLMTKVITPVRYFFMHFSKSFASFL